MYEGSSKWLSMLKEVAPRLARVALLASASIARASAAGIHDRRIFGPELPAL
jgi:hypothetical protein